MTEPMHVPVPEAPAPDGPAPGAPGPRRDAHAVLMASFAGPAAPGWVLDLIRAGLGSVCLFGSNLTGDDAAARALTGVLHAAAPGGVLVALDEEGGDVTRLDAHRGSPLPSPAVLGLVDDLDLTRRVVAGLARRLRAVGVDLDLAPDADVDSDPRNPVIGVRSFGPDPAVVARHVAVFVEELQAGGVSACVKHFPGHGDTATDSHTSLPEVTAPAGLLRDRDLVPFAAAVRAGVDTVMTGHLLVPALDPGSPASTSALTTALLRDELGFRGVIVTDAIDMAGVSGPSAHGSRGAAVVAALVAGADLVCLGADRTEAEVAGILDAVVAAVQGGHLDAARLAEAAGRVRALAALAAARRAQAPAVREAVLEDAGRAAEAAARGALRVDGALPPLAGALVLRFTTAASIAVGQVPWGLAAHAADLLPGAGFADVTPDDVHAAVEAVRAGGPRPVVAVVRDAARSPWVAAALGELAGCRPELVVVEMGHPGGPPLPGRAVLRTATASAAGARAAADVLAGAR